MFTLLLTLEFECMCTEPALKIERTMLSRRPACCLLCMQRRTNVQQTLNNVHRRAINNACYNFQSIAPFALIHIHMNK